MKTVKLTEHQKQIAVIALAAVVVFILGVVVVVVPGFERWRKLQRDVDQVSARQDALHQISLKEKRFKTLETLAVSEKDRYLITSQLASLGTQHDLQVDSLNPEMDTAATGLFRPYRVQMTAQGNFYSLMGFLQDVAGMRPAVAIEKMQIGQDFGLREGTDLSGGSGPQLQISVLLSSLIKNTSASKSAEMEA